ncbi:MAG TPA: hypothetical protein VEK11_18410 [Thermoanaerobaculia bacterium]|nr:hypothetical protein [Thermoanaerobaculia bacterium]
MRRGVELALLALVLAAIAFAYRDATRLFWTYDDAFLLRVVEQADLNDYFGSKPFWRSMPSAMFVPLLLAWYEAGARAGDAAGFYVLAIALLLAALVCVYAALRRWLGAVESLSAIAIIGLGPPVVSVVIQLMATHYLIALAFSALSVGALAPSRGAAPGDGGATPPGQPAGRWPSAVFYLAAILAKEIAIPLPFLLLLLPGVRVRHVVPHGIALVLYFAWRKIMIGAFLGGYGWAVTADNADDLLLSLPRQLATTLTLAALVLLAVIALRLRSRRFAFAFVIALGAAIAPVLPVAREPQSRYAFAAWVTLAVFFAIAARSRAVVCAIGVIAVAVAFQFEWRKVFAVSEEMSAESRFVMRAPANATLRLPRTPPAAMAELQWHRAKTGAPQGLQWFYDDVWLCGGRVQGRRLFDFDARTRRIVDVSPQAHALQQKHCSAIRENAPLTADFRFENGTLFWTFGPYERGAYHVVFADGIQAFTVPREDAYRLGEMDGIALRVRYDAPEGWVTYSPEIALDFRRTPTFRWHR